MKRFLVSILVPAAAAIAVVGSGFSVWYFGDKQVSKNSSADLEVKNMLHVGTFADMSSKFKLTLDQTETGRAQALKGKTDDLDGLEKTGIKLTNSESGKSSTITYLAPTQANAVDQGTFVGTDVKLVITTTFTIDADLAKWVKVSNVDGNGTLTNVGNVYTYTWKANDSTSTISNAQTTLDLVSGVTWCYVKKDATSPYGSLATANRDGFDTWEPLNAAEYSAMYAAVKGKSITINTKAELVKA